MKSKKSLASNMHDDITRITIFNGQVGHGSKEAALQYDRRYLNQDVSEQVLKATVIGTNHIRRDPRKQDGIKAFIPFHCSVVLYCVSVLLGALSHT